MSTTGMDVFDKTLQATHIWLDEIMNDIGPDRALAWKVLSTVLQKLRDRLPIELAAHLGAQLPLLVRGAYYDKFDPTKMPADWHTAEQFLDEVREGLSGSRSIGSRVAVDAVFGVLDRHLSEGQIDKVYRSMPKSIRGLWVEPEA
ncbi:MAG: DUF2267 domain-containing protein [Sphingomonadaceae bacterium]|nr:MAG: DUF2267 domain-containing protein [Sphingomonadaceae bacterium]